MNTTFSFTQKRIIDMQPQATTKTYTDQKLRNLKLTITAKGSKTYYCRFKAEGKEFNLKIADAHQVTLDDARARAIELLNFHQGNTPASQHGDNANRQTLNDLFQLYVDAELSLKATVAGRTHSMEVAYKKHIKSTLGKEAFVSITKKSARQFFKELESKGYGVHNKCLSALKAAINYIIDFEEDLAVTFNPFERLKKMPGVTRNRYLTHEEANRLFEALNEADNQDVADIYRLALFTGARLSNVKQMKWQDLNLSSGIWLIPALSTKTNKHYEIPLHRLAIDILFKRQNCNTSSEYVFASHRSKYGYITGGDPVWKAAIKSAGLYHENPNIRPRPHDLRRTFATWQIQSGADISVVSKALCHTSLKHTVIYAHTDVNQVRNSIEGAFEMFK